MKKKKMKPYCHKRLPIAVILAFASALLSLSGYGQKNNTLHQQALVIDAHNDFLSTSVEKGYRFDQNLRGKTHTDLERMKEGGVDIQIFSVWCDARPDAFSFANREIDTLYAILNRNPEKISMIYSPADLSSTIKQKKLGAMIGVEGGHMIEDDLSKLDSLYNRGARYMTLTWNNSTPWASSAMEETSGKIPADKRGLSPFGRQVVNRMNALGMMVDLSHVGEQTFKDAMATTSKPVIVSHSCVWSLCPVFRNLKDYQIDAVGKNGGVICINFFSGFLDSNFMKRNKAFMENHQAEKDSLQHAGMEKFFMEDYLFKKYQQEVADMRPPISLLIDHIDYIKKRIGVDHIGLGSDFDGINSAPRELNGIEDFPKITDALRARGYSKKEIRKILGENLERVFRENQRY
jgi:membrane dipeptidase